MSNMIVGIKFKVVGVTFNNENGTSRQSIIRHMVGDTPIKLVREPQNPHDINAIMVMTPMGQIGYIARQYADILAPLMDAGRKFVARVSDTGYYKNTHYCEITVDEV